MKKGGVILNFLLLFMLCSCVSTQISNSNPFVTSAKSKIGEKFVKMEELYNCNSKEEVELLKVYQVTNVIIKKENDMLYRIEYFLSTENSDTEIFVEFYDFEYGNLKVNRDSQLFTAKFIEHGSSIDYRTETKRILSGTTNYMSVEIDLDSATLFVKNSYDKEVILKYKISTKIAAENNDSSIYASIGNSISGSFLYKNTYPFSLYKSKCIGFYESDNNITAIEGSITFYGDDVDYIYSAIQDLNSLSQNVKINDIITGTMIIGGEKIKIISETKEKTIKYYVSLSGK